MHKIASIFRGIRAARSLYLNVCEQLSLHLILCRLEGIKIFSTKPLRLHYKPRGIASSFKSLFVQFRTFGVRWLRSRLAWPVEAVVAEYDHTPFVTSASCWRRQCAPRSRPSTSRWDPPGRLWHRKLSEGLASEWRRRHCCLCCSSGPSSSAAPDAGTAPRTATHL
jgi:hypothetical protein